MVNKKRKINRSSVVFYAFFAVILAMFLVGRLQ